MPKLATEAPATPAFLRPFLFHGVELDWRDGASEAVGDCPFCGREGKFNVEIDSGKWWCFICQEKPAIKASSIESFLHALWTKSDEHTNDYDELAANRKLLFPDTLMAWGVCRSIVDNVWLVPGWAVDGKIGQLYRYVQTPERMVLLPTPTLPNRLHGVDLFDDSKPLIYLCEGPFDAIALWETLRIAKVNGNELMLTGNEVSSLLAVANVLAVPNCGSVGTPFVKFLELFRNKAVVLMFDSDRPSINPKTGTESPPAGYAASKRAAGLLHSCKELRWLDWGSNGYDATLPKGYDVRDWLSKESEPAKRVKQLETLLGKIQPVPKDWLDTAAKVGSNGTTSTHCHSWKQLIGYWSKAMSWRQDLDDALSVMMAVALSTLQQGDQLFLSVIGDAGSGKSKFCDAMVVSKHCFALEHLTGFHSGWKGENGEDFSLLARINGKTLITSEGDILMSSPRFTEIMSQQRRIFDGTSGASYKNRKEDMRYTGLRTPWIIAGTPALLNMNQSRLGDRFLRIIIDPPEQDEKEAILRRVGYAALRSVLKQANDDPNSILEEKMLLAFRMTGGYVDWLRSDPESHLAKLNVDEDWLIERCTLLAEYVAVLRARPDSSKEDKQDTKELPTRLTAQFVRLACCLAVVLNKTEIDNEVIRRVKKVAIDTSRGRTYEIVQSLAVLTEKEKHGITVGTLAVRTGHSDVEERQLVRFLRKLHVVRMKEVLTNGVSSQKRYSLTPWMSNLHLQIKGLIDA
jgi:hypothetical protein